MLSVFAPPSSIASPLGSTTPGILSAYAPGHDSFNPLAGYTPANPSSPTSIPINWVPLGEDRNAPRYNPQQTTPFASVSGPLPGGITVSPNTYPTTPIQGPLAGATFNGNQVVVGADGTVGYWYLSANATSASDSRYDMFVPLGAEQIAGLSSSFSSPPSNTEASTPSVFGTPLGSTGSSSTNFRPVSSTSSISSVNNVPLSGPSLDEVISRTTSSTREALSSVLGTPLGSAITDLLTAGTPLSSTSIAGNLGTGGSTTTVESYLDYVNTYQFTPSPRSGPSNEPNPLTKSSPLRASLVRGDPVLSYEWVALIVDTQNPLTIEPIYIESVVAPTVSFDQKVRFSDGANRTFAGPLSVSSMQLSLAADAYGKAFKLANNWIFGVYDQLSGGFYAPSEYKKSVKLFVHDAKKGVIVQFDFIGVWPVSWNGNNWDQSSSLTTMQLTLSVDRIRVSSSAY